MREVIRTLKKEVNISCPSWLPDSIILEARVGSYSYGCQENNSSDIDVSGICVPPKEIIYPHLTGYIPGFGTHPQKFDQYQRHHIKNKYDVTIFNIVKFFHLCMNNNPNIVDILYSDPKCITAITDSGIHLIKNKHLFLSKVCWRTFRGYARSQLRKIKKETLPTGIKRLETVEKFGFDTKFAYHIVRLALECEQILSTGDLILDKDKDIYIEIRNGRWTKQRIFDFFHQKEAYLEKLYDNSKLPDYPDENVIKRLLIDCLEIQGVIESEMLSYLMRKR